MASARQAPPSQAARAIEQIEPKRARIFISYRHCEPDMTVAKQAWEALRQEHDVFIDETLETGELWEKKIDQELRRADFLITFLSVDSVASENVKAEIRIAHRLWKEDGCRPRIIPVRLAYQEALEYDLARLLDPIQHYMDWSTDDDTPDLIDELKSILSGRVPAVAEGPVPGLARFTVTESRRRRNAATFVTPAGLQAARESLTRRRLLWISGPPGVGKKFLGLALALEQTGREVYEFRSTLSWRQVAQKNVRGAVVLLPDALAATRLASEELETELLHLRRLLDRDNLVIATCSDEEFAEASKEMRESGWDPGRYGQVSLDERSYHAAAKVEMLQKLVRHAHTLGLINEKQMQWAEHLFKAKDGGEDEAVRQFRKCVEAEWQVIDLEDFVSESLPRATTKADLVQLLRRGASLQERIHRWFLDRDESTRCFLLAAALCSDLSPEDFWARYKEIVQGLRKFNPALATLAVGVCRHACAPYVAEEGPLQFVDERVAAAVIREIALFYREYFIELIPLFVAWSIPSISAGLQREELDPAIEETETIRREIARMLGEMAKVRLDDLSELLNRWATHPKSAVRSAAAVALAHASADVEGARRCVVLLRSWRADTSGTEDGSRRRMTAASALWRIASTSTTEDLGSFALVEMKVLARDPDRYVRSVVAYGMPRVIRRRLSPEIPTIMRRLAGDTDAIIRRRIAIALDELRRHRSVAEPLFEELASSNNSDRQWTAIYSVLVARKASLSEKERLTSLMTKQPLVFCRAVATAVSDTVRDVKHHDRAWPNLEWLAEPFGNRRSEFVAALLQGYLEDRAMLDELLESFRTSERPNVISICSAVRSGFYQILMESPAKFVFALKEGVLDQNSGRKHETEFVVRSILQPSPRGRREDLISTLVAAFSEGRPVLEQLLAVFRSSGTTDLEAIPREVRGAFFARLLASPPEFLEEALKGLTAPEPLREETLYVIDNISSSAEHEPLISALASVSFSDRGRLEELLAALRGSARPALEAIPGTVRALIFRRLLPSPVPFVEEALRALGGPEPLRTEALDAMESFANRSPSGQRTDLSDALVVASRVKQVAVEQLLDIFRSSGRTALVEVAHGVRSQVLTQLLAAPVNLIRELLKGLRQPGPVRAETLSILEILASPSSHRYRTQLIAALRALPRDSSADLDWLLASFKVSGKPTLMTLQGNVRRQGPWIAAIVVLAFVVCTLVYILLSEMHC